MNIFLVSQLSPKSDYSSDWIDEVSEKLKSYFIEFNSIEDIKDVYIGVIFDEFHESSLYDINKFHFKKKKKELEFDVFLDFKKLKSISKDVFISELLNKIERSIIVVMNQQLKTSNFRAFHELFSKFQLDFPEIGLISVAKESSHLNKSTIDRNKQVIQYKSLGDGEFWSIINKIYLNKKASSFENSTEDLIQHLQKLTDEQIIGFHISLREKMEELNKKKIVNVFAKITGFVSDDLWIENRCRLISLGETIFNKAIVDPKFLLEIENVNWDEGEALIYVADTVIKEKHKNKYYNEMPSEIASSVLGIL